MQLKYITAILMAGGLFIGAGCKHDHPHNPDGSHPTEGDHAHASDGSHVEAGAHGHAHELEALSYTIWTDVSELFVEFKPLIVGEESSFAAHFSNMKTFKAVAEGSAKVALMKGGKTIRENSVDAPSSPGIFRPVLTPENTGVFDLVFTLETADFSDKITIPNIKVYENESAAIHDNLPAAGGDEISYLKEQAWKTDFAIAQAKRRQIHEVIRTSGEIQPVKGQEKIVSAKSGGIVFYKNPKLQEGREVRRGEVLFSINSQGLLESDVASKYGVAKAKLEKSKADFERAEKLMTQQIIGRKEFENRKMELAVAEAEWQALAKSNASAGQTVTAPMAGIIKNLTVSDGEFVNEGAPLIEITNSRRLMLHAEVPQQYLPKLSKIKTANFKTPYREEVQSLADYRGKLVSVGKVLEKGKHFLPVWFELDNLNELIPGSYVELFLLTNPIDNQLVIPRSALMQDYNVNYVYVQTSGESFEKREVKTGIDDGVNVQVLSGLAEGDWVVTRGAYQIKMASMSSTIPAHGHAH